MAPGPVLGNYFPNGGYVARTDWAAKNPGLAAEVPHGDEPVARATRRATRTRSATLLPAAIAEHPPADLDDR